MYVSNESGVLNLFLPDLRHSGLAEINREFHIVQCGLPIDNYTIEPEGIVAKKKMRISMCAN